MADTLALGASALPALRVRVPSSAQQNTQQIIKNGLGDQGRPFSPSQKLPKRYIVSSLFTADCNKSVLDFAYIIVVRISE